MSDPFPPRRSPDGRIEVRFAAQEMRMSLWVLEPTVIRTRDDRSIISLTGSGWDAGGVAPSFPEADRVELHLRRYPKGNRIVDVVLDVETELWWFADDPETRLRTGALVDELRRSRKRPAGGGSGRG